MPKNMPRLEKMEKEVILLALEDPISSLASPKRALQWLFGQRAHKLPLANEQLEALRRYVVLARARDFPLPAPEKERLHAAGYDAAKREAINRFIASHRDTPPSRLPGTGRLTERLQRP